MNQITPEKNSPIKKTLTIVGFIAVILLAVWLAIQAVGIIPSAFNLLTSATMSVDSQETSLIVTTDTSVVGTNEVFTIIWTSLHRAGSYSFIYSCTEDISLHVVTSQGNIQNLKCNTPFILGNKTTLDVVIASEAKRFLDINYTIIHTPENDSSITIKTESQITIVNTNIPFGSDTSQTEELVENEVENINNIFIKDEEPAITIIPEPIVIERIIYAIPISDPSGKIDLEVKYIGVGKLVGRKFIQTATIDSDTQGAFQFSVKNIGTKTADIWSYKVDIPSGIEHNSSPQMKLKPNEEATITIGFQGITQRGVKKFGAQVTAKNDVNKNNNSFVWAVEIVE